MRTWVENCASIFIYAAHIVARCKIYPFRGFWIWNQSFLLKFSITVWVSCCFSKFLDIPLVSKLITCHLTLKSAAWSSDKMYLGDSLCAKWKLDSSQDREYKSDGIKFMATFQIHVLLGEMTKPVLVCYDFRMLVARKTKYMNFLCDSKELWMERILVERKMRG